MLYQEFCAPYNERVLSAFGGGGSLHFCGGGINWPAEQLPKLNICCLNFGNPELQDVLTVWADAQKNGICVVGYGDDLPYSFSREKMEQGMRTGVTLIVHADTYEEAQKVREAHLTWSAYNMT